MRKKEKILLLCIMKTPYSVLLYSMHERKKISFFSYAANAWSVDSRKEWVSTGRNDCVYEQVVKADCTSSLYCAKQLQNIPEKGLLTEFLDDFCIGLYTETGKTR